MDKYFLNIKHEPSLLESMEKLVQPSQQEVQEVLQQLREIPCTPQFRLNGEMRAHGQAVLSECARSDSVRVSVRSAEALLLSADRLLERGSADMEGD